MVVASFNGSGDGRQQGSGGKVRHNNEIEVTAVLGGNNMNQRSTAEMNDGI